MIYINKEIIYLIIKKIINKANNEKINLNKYIK